MTNATDVAIALALPGLILFLVSLVAGRPGVALIGLGVLVLAVLVGREEK